MKARQLKGVSAALVLGVAGCFPPPHLKADVTGDATTETDTSGTGDTIGGDADVPAHCTQDEQCAGLAAAPCVVGRCEQGRCITAQVAVTCDDGDPCTTADRCAAGVCKGRAFTSEEAKNWALVLTPTGEGGARLHLNRIARIGIQVG